MDNICELSVNFAQWRCGACRDVRTILTTVCYQFMADISQILRFFPDLDTAARSRYEALDSLYHEWNEKINVISRKDIDNLYVNHVLHSLAIAAFWGPLAPGTTVLDMGTGGGFPGIPLAIMYPGCRFHLIDRIGKKIRVATEVAKAVGLDNVTFQHGDIGECRDRYNYVVSRAVMRLDALVPLVRRNVSPVSIPANRYANGLVCLKGGDLADEISGVHRPVMVYPVCEYMPLDAFDTKDIVYVPL